MKKFLQEFKEFALRGNVMDLAIGVIIGAAFQAIINSLVKDIISPMIGLIANTDLSALQFQLLDVPIRYGSFLTAVINFIIMALAIFLLVKAMNIIASLGRRKESGEPDAPTIKICPFCMSEINIAAARCPHCTSKLQIAEDTEETPGE